ncbi:MAG: MBL fold metallo-hydrolase RNA specificity domain-containing protein, partial [Actinomycetota bacterium]
FARSCRFCGTTNSAEIRPAMSALTMLSKGDSRYVKVGENDVVIFSSHAIPGNEQNVNKVIDALLRRGANVVHSGIADVHATGHAQAEDIKTYLNVTEPQWFVPIHGEYRHMVANAELAKIMGVSPRKVLLCEDGDVIEITDSGIDFAGRISAEFVVPQKRRDRAKRKNKGAKLGKRHKKH